MKRLDDHLQEVGETYPQHFKKATGFGMAMLVGGMACLVHGLLPNLFVTSGSDRIRRLYDEMVENRSKRPPAQAPDTAKFA